MGGYSLVTFGYTTCSGNCTMTVPNVVNATKQLKQAGLDVTPYLFSVDPDRDTTKGMAAYAKRFGSQLVGLTGELNEIAQAAEAFGVLYAKQNPSDKTSPILHSPQLFLLGPTGRFEASFSESASSEKIAI